MPEEFLESEESLGEFLAAFWAGTFPVKQWTHGAHVAMAASVLWSEPVRVAVPLIREGIKKYNVAQGGENTATSGYHETLTRLWIGLVAGFMASLPADASRLQAVRATHARFSGERGFFKGWYSFDVVKCERARAEWVPPDRVGTSVEVHES